MKTQITLLFLFFGISSLFSQNYIFYLHGRIVENQGPEAVDKVNGYGEYKYYDILDSLKQKKNVVISEVRARDTDVKIYAVKVKKQIDSLIKLGIKPEKISVLGVSKGSIIAMYVSSYVKNKSVNYIFIAACGDGLLADDPSVDFSGNILSIYEKTDLAGNCEYLRKKSTGINKYKELEINTGLRHGFFYQPLNEWLNPSLQWINNKYE